MQSLAPEQRRYFAVVGKASGGEFGVYKLAIDDDLERCARARGDLNHCAVFFYKQVPRTEGARLVVSTNAVFDSDVRHGGHIHFVLVAVDWNLEYRAGLVDRMFQQAGCYVFEGRVDRIRVEQQIEVFGADCSGVDQRVQIDHFLPK